MTIPVIVVASPICSFHLLSAVVVGAAGEAGIRM
jgi:hypothetical protein